MDNAQIEDISFVSELRNLGTLFLGNNQITDVTPLSNLTNLTTLDLSNNKITDTSALDGLTNLTTCILDGNPIGLVTDIRLNETNISLMIGDTVQLIATVTPEDALNQELEWTSSDTGVAQVDETGMVTAVAEGTATITATATDGSGVSASCEITVTDNSQEEPDTEEPDTSEPEEDITEGVLIQTSGKINMKSGIAYSLSSGTWKVSGDNTVYGGNITFYVSQDGEYEFFCQ